MSKQKRSVEAFQAAAQELKQKWTKGALAWAEANEPELYEKAEMSFKRLQRPWPIENTRSWLDAVDEWKQAHLKVLEKYNQTVSS